MIIPHPVLMRKWGACPLRLHPPQQTSQPRLLVVALPAVVDWHRHVPCVGCLCPHILILPVLPILAQIGNRESNFSTICTAREGRPRPRSCSCCASMTWRELPVPARQLGTDGAAVCDDGTHTRSDSGPALASATKGAEARREGRSWSRLAPRGESGAWTVHRLADEKGVKDGTLFCSGSTRRQ
ncbi:hypothetical protein B0H14DRAFT_2918415, partial [Mycena olivaceomarginata]